MRRLIAWWWRKLAWKVERHYSAYLVRQSDWQEVVNETASLDVFCNKSGFLWDGRYSGGRHAERKIRRMAGEINRHMRNGAGGPWRGKPLFVGRSDRKLRAVELHSFAGRDGS